jgi:hypothetical protein
MPEQDAVLAITAGVQDMQAVLNLVWKHLLPAMEAEPLPSNPQAQQELTQRLERLEIVPVKDQVADSVTALVTGKRFVLEENELQIKAVTFEFDQAGCLLTLENVGGTSQVACGNGTWRKGITTLDNHFPRKVAASGGWTGPETYLINLYFLTPVLTKTPPPMVVGRLPFGLTIACQFYENGVILDCQANVSFRPIEQPRIQGQLA